MLVNYKPPFMLEKEYPMLLPNLISSLTNKNYYKFQPNLTSQIFSTTQFQTLPKLVLISKL